MNWKKIVLPCALIILLFLVVFGGLHIMESTVFNSEQEESAQSSSKTVEKDEISYFPRQDITTVLVMGIDDEGTVEDSGHNRNNSLADVVALLIFDEEKEKVNIIAFNRDSMVDMPVLEQGKRAGTVNAQLSLAHSYGSGLEDSCENTVWTVSDLLGGFDIDYYVAVNMGAIPMINDAVGGVTVNVEDDFSAVNPAITMGEFTLVGDQALTFIRARKNLGDQLNISRMERHKEYVKGFFLAFKENYAADSFIVSKLLEAANGYMVTNCSGNTIIGMAERYQDYELGEIVSPKGENILGEQYYEFYIDEEDLQRIVIELLYAPK